MAVRKPRTIFLLRLLQLGLYNFLVDALRPFALTPLQYMVLSIASSRGGCSSAELARRFQIAPQSMTEVVASLERKLLIARRQSAAHGRVLAIRLTAAGTRLLAKCDRAVDQLEVEAFACFGAAELAAFRGLMSKALANFVRPSATRTEAGASRRGGRKRVPAPDAGIALGAGAVSAR